MRQTLSKNFFKSAFLVFNSVLGAIALLQGVNAQTTELALTINDRAVTPPIASHQETETVVETTTEEVETPSDLDQPTGEVKTTLKDVQPITEIETTSELVQSTTGEVVSTLEDVQPRNVGEVEIPSTVAQTTTIPYSDPALPPPNPVTEPLAPVLPTVTPEKVLQIEINPAGDPRVVADGRSTITLEGRVTNESGALISEDQVITLTASAGQFVGADGDEDRAGFQVTAIAGQFTARLQSAISAQKVQIRAAIEEKVAREESDRLTASPPIPSYIPTEEAYTQVEFVTYLRPSLVSGVVNLRIGEKGTDYWGSFREFLNPDTIDDGTEIHLSGAVFATGKIGEWLFTGAYNSDRALNLTCDGTVSLFRGPQFCEQQYPVYGDSSTTDYITPSTDSVYLRFERPSRTPGAEPDYGMWGDYNTTEFARASQLYTATTRALHGFKANYSFGNLQLTGFFSPDVEGYQRDTIPPNGTSGYYFLSRRLLIEGSENIFLETEELNRPGTVIQRQALSRGADYEIDYDRGTILFRRPVLSTEFDPFGTTLVRRIVATYQYEGQGGEDTNIYAGRAQYNVSQVFGQETWAAASYLRENQGNQDFELYGADFLVSLGRNSRLIGEYARSSNNSVFSGLVSGSAYRLELSGTPLPGVTGRAYYRSVEEGFANNSTVSFTPGQTRYGAAVAAKVGTTTSLQFAYDREDNFGIAPAIRSTFVDLFSPSIEAPPGSRVDNELMTYSAGVQQKIGRADLSVSYVHRDRIDRVSDTFDSNADQLVSRLNVPITERVTFRAQNELNLGSGEDPLYPNRTTFGVDWAAYPGVTLRLAHQFLDGGLLGNNSITSLDTLLERPLGPNTNLTGRYSLLGGFNGITGQGAVGITHTWLVYPGLRLNFGYEHILNDVFEDTAAGRRFPQPYAFGQSASSLGLAGGDTYSVGAEYTASQDFKASTRFERRTGSGGDNLVFSINAAGKPSPALTALFRYEQANYANQTLQGLGDTRTLKLGLAFRDPNDDRFNALLRYEYRRNPSVIPETLLLGSGTGSEDHVFSAEAIYAPNWRWEFYTKFAMRNSTTYLAQDFSNSSSIYLGQVRATYRVGYRWDLAVEGRYIAQPSVSYYETGLAVETGYYVSPDLRVYLGYSFGSVDDRDFSGYRSDGGIYAGVTFKVNELFNGFGRQRPTPPQQRESVVSQQEKVPETSAVPVEQSGI